MVAPAATFTSPPTEWAKDPSSATVVAPTALSPAVAAEGPAEASSNLRTASTAAAASLASRSAADAVKDDGVVPVPVFPGPTGKDTTALVLLGAEWKSYRTECIGKRDSRRKMGWRSGRGNGRALRGVGV